MENKKIYLQDSRTVQDRTAVISSTKNISLGSPDSVRLRTELHNNTEDHSDAHVPTDARQTRSEPLPTTDTRGIAWTNLLCGRIPPGCSGLVGPY